MSRTDFSLTTRWLIPAPLNAVWQCLIETEKWPEWWGYVEKVDDAHPVNSPGFQTVWRYYWRTSLPYRLEIDLNVTQFDPYRSIAADVTGDLIGRGDCLTVYREDTAATEVIFIWNVSVAKPWMKLMAGFARPLFVWNHEQVMKSGETGMTRYLTLPLTRSQ